MEAETLLLRRKPPVGVQPLSLDAVWPVHAAGAWPAGLSLRREALSAERR